MPALVPGDAAPGSISARRLAPSAGWPDSANHSLPSGRAAMPVGCVSDPGIRYSLICTLLPAVAVVGIRPTALWLYSVNHSAPSGPAAICSGWLLGAWPDGGGSGYSLTTPEVVIAPIPPPPPPSPPPAAQGPHAVRSLRVRSM